MTDPDFTQPTKTCTKCGKEKQLEGFDKRSKCKNGRRPICKQCGNAERRQYHARLTPEAKANLALANKAWRTKNADYLRVFEQQKRQKNLLIIRERERSYRLKNRAKRAARNKAWREANKAYVKAANKAWCLAHPEQHKANNKAWKQNNRDKVTVLHAKRRARQQELPATFTDEQAQFARQYFHYACAVCGNEEGFQWVIGFDHWIPIVDPLCPGTVAINMIPLCHGLGGCNNIKHDKHPSAWLAEQFGTRKAAALLRKIEVYFAVVRERFLTD